MSCFFERNPQAMRGEPHSSLLSPLTRRCIVRRGPADEGDGHVVEEGTTLSAGGTGDRWRAPGPVKEGEVLFAGGRVLSPEGGHAVVAAWSERVRYAARRSGYHGG